MKIVAVLAAALYLVVPSASAQNYPTKSIRLIVPYPPGGGVDGAGRVIAQALTEQLGQQVVVENRGGATGRIGTELVAKSPPDGYTLLLGSGAPNAVLPSVTPRLPYDALKSFAPISLVGTTDYTLVVHPSTGVRSLRQLLALAKAHPGQLTYGSSGYLSNTHLAGELLNQLAHINIAHVPYKGTGPALVGVLTGETAVSFGSGPAAAPHVKANRLRAIATTGAKRRSADLPAIAETLPGYDVAQWYAVLAPAGTPREIVERLHKEIVHALASPKTAEQLTNLDTDAVSCTPEALLALIKSEMQKWAKVTQIAKIKPE
jgi:tripartite-type tricarboxylate transporter receptor subunit TctC